MGLLDFFTRWVLSPLQPIRTAPPLTAEEVTTEEISEGDPVLLGAIFGPEIPELFACGDAFDTYSKITVGDTEWYARPVWPPEAFDELGGLLGGARPLGANMVTEGRSMTRSEFEREFGVDPVVVYAERREKMKLRTFASRLVHAAKTGDAWGQVQ